MNTTDCPCNYDVLQNMTSLCNCEHDVTTAFPNEQPSAHEPYSVISKETRVTIETVLSCGIIWVLVVVGLPGNVVNCVVFRRQGLHDRMNVSLFCLGLVDFLCVLSWFVMTSPCLLAYALPERPLLSDWWKWTSKKYVRGLHRACLSTSAFITLLIAVERCVCVLIPLWAPNLIRTRTMTLIIAVAALVMQLLYLVYPFKFDVVSVYDEEQNLVKVMTQDTAVYRDHQALLNVQENVILMTAIPVANFIVVVVATAITVVRIMHLVKWRDTVSSDTANVKKSQVSLVKMLVVISGIYIVTNTPQVMLGLVRTFMPTFRRQGQYSNIYQASHHIYLTLSTSNSILNIFVYYTRSSRFRAEFKKLIACSCRRPAKTIADSLRESRFSTGALTTERSAM